MKTPAEYYAKWYEKNKEKARTMKAAAMKRYRAENPEKFREQSRNAKAKLRAKLFELYGWNCAICGFDDTRALTLDHIAQNGNTERRELGERGVYYRALAEFRPLEYRILCMNCQFIERHKHDWDKRPAVAATAWRLLHERIGT